MPTATDTRARLLAAARQAFADLGYGRARVEDIVARAGVGHGTFYAYFRNKRAALAALVSENAATLVELAGQPWRPGDVRASLVEVLGGLSDLYDRDADLIALWTEASIQDPELGRVLDLGLEPHLLGDSLLDSLLNIALEYRDRIDPEVVMPTVDWRKGKARQRVHKAPVQPSAL